MYYKLTSQSLQTHNDFQWTVGEWFSIKAHLRGKNDLCTNSWFHCYNNLLLATLLNPAHAQINNPRVFRCYVKGSRKLSPDHKTGFAFMKLGEELTLPEVSLTQRRAFGILCAKEVYSGDGRWVQWAGKWLSGTDRSIKTSEKAGCVVLVKNTLIDYAKYSAMYAANAVSFKSHRYVAKCVADAAAHAAYAREIDLVAMAEKAIGY